MLEPWKIIKNLESTNSRIDKENILKLVLLCTPEDIAFWEGCELALNPRKMFGIKKIPLSTQDGPGLSHNKFMSFVERLVTRKITGNEAVKLVHLLMNESTMEQWNHWYSRILMKDLKCGVSEKTINKVRPKTISVFSCQLANDASGDYRHLPKDAIIDYKLDGVRALAFALRNNDAFGTLSVTIVSRNGRILENFESITKELEKLDIKEDLVFDGEITSQNFQKLMTQVNRKKNVDTTDAIFNIFDVIPFADFFNGEYLLPQTHRRDWLDTIFEQKELSSVKVLPYVRANLGDQDGINLLEDHRTNARILNLEGIMVKDSNSTYRTNRNNNWLKIKPNITVDLTVVGFEEGTGRNAGRLGALICEGEDQGRKIKVNVGSGISDDLRDDIWLNKNHVLGNIVEIRADSITQNQDGTYSLRFPRFVRFRGFEIGEKF